MSIPVTWLYVPGDRPERFDKAMASGADVVIIDLEDAVDGSRKDAARENTVRRLADRPPAEAGPELHVRVNDLATARGRDDLGALAGLPGLDAVRLPKVDSPDDLALVDDTFGDQATPAHALLESARGLANADAIAAHPRVAGLALGEQDLTAALAIRLESAFDQIRLRVVLAAAAAGLDPVPMSIYPDIADTEGLRASCAHGRDLGMFGRTAIHPRQIPAIRAAFRPTAEEISRAREVVEAAERAGDRGVGAVALPDGRFVDAPVVSRARDILALADRIS
ncbi:HpcH/HpaI aldolase/citrate lyase family protein [Streptomyces hainanensis]|uniref:CoA ester lyase n=1 Tax=Streptomyces hainanensis TaxID=402648 RepID=A0A4R4TLX6_9ACTN|nr:CoA ester lyase [Streptomyces hainanensis]TDC78800.1 CoA ester lyase [Streptomyces hainanensis]